MVSVSALAKPQAQMLRLVGSGLKFCKQRLKYGCHNFFSTSKIEVSKNNDTNIQNLPPPPVVFGYLYVDKRFSLEITFSRDKMYQTRIFSII